MRVKILTAMVFAAASMAYAGQSTLNEWCFYVNTLDVNHSCASATPTVFNPPVQGATYSASPGDQDLGTVSIVVGAGTYNVFSIWDYNVGGGQFNQYATTVGTVTAGQVYSVDAAGDPTAGGAVTAYTPGNLNSQYSAGTLDNTNHLSNSDCAAPNSCEPVGVSIGYTNITVPDGEQELITFTVSGTPPSSGFYVSQINPNTCDSLFFSADPVLIANPEPASLALMGTGLCTLVWFVRRRRRA